MKDFVGLSVLAILLVAALRLVSGATDWVVPTLVVFPSSAPVALYIWREPRSPEGPMDWLLMALGTVAWGAIFLAIDATLGHSKHASASLWQAAQAAGGMFGFGLTVLVCPGFTCICVAGAVRAAYGR